MTPSFAHTQLAQTLKPVYKTLVYIFDCSYSLVYINRHTKRDLIWICTVNHICGANIFLYSMCKVIKTAKTFPYDILLPNSLLTIHLYYLSYWRNPNNSYILYIFRILFSFPNISGNVIARLPISFTFLAAEIQKNELPLYYKLHLIFFFT